MSRAGFLTLVALAGMGALCAPAAAQTAPAAKAEANVLCRFHGEGCAAAPADWTWKRLEPRAGGYSVELPCDERQANLFGQVLATSRAKFEAARTRACMKATSGFTATLLGLTGSPKDVAQPELDGMLRGAPDMFTAFKQRSLGKAFPETTLKGRRAIVNTIEKGDSRAKVAIVEVGRFAIVMLSADIRTNFPGTRAQSDAAVTRFLDSLEIAE